MRFKNAYIICQENIDIITSPLDMRRIESSQKELYEFEKWEMFNKSLTALYDIQVLNKIIINIYELIDNSVKYAKKNITPCLYKEDKEKFIVCRNKLTEYMNFIISMGDTLNFGIEENTFDIKIPPNITFSELIKCMKSMEFIFTQCPYLNQKDDKITFEAVDVGSAWFVFAAAGTFIMERLGKIVDLAVNIKSHILTCRAQANQLKTMKLQNDLLENVIDTQKKMIGAFLDVSVSQLQKEYSDIKTTPEEDEKTKHAISELANWMTKGLEIYASINASKDVQALFPSSEKQRLELKDIERIAEKSKENYNKNSGNN